MDALSPSMQIPILGSFDLIFTVNASFHIYDYLSPSSLEMRIPPLREK